MISLWDGTASELDEMVFWRCATVHPMSSSSPSLLNPMAVAALVKCFVLEWSNELDCQMYHNLPSIECYVRSNFTYNDNSVSSKYRIALYSQFTFYLFLIHSFTAVLLFCCLAYLSPLSSPRIFSTATSSLLPPTSTSLLPHFNPPQKVLLSPPRSPLLAFICWH